MPAWFQHAWCSSFVLTLGHFLWQGTLVALVLGLALRATKSVSMRYWLSLSALLLMAACPIATFAWLEQPLATTPRPEVQPIVAQELAPMTRVEPEVPDVEVASANQELPPRPIDTVSPEPFDPMLRGTLNRVDERSWWQRFAPQLTTAYLGGVGLMLLRLAIGLWGGKRLRRRAIPITDASLIGAMQRQAEALGLKLLPALAYCERVTVPTVIGVLKPMILLPLTLASGLSPEQIESVLAHELAHLRRYDHLVNLLQRVIESLLFFHPAVWWVSHRVREEREHCCDDLVVACGAMPLDYATSLLRVAELSRASRLGRSVAAVSLLATGDKPSSLRQRIARLLGESATPSLRISPRVLTVSFSALLIGLATLIQLGVSNDEAPNEGEATHPPLEFRIAVTHAERDQDGLAWFPMMKPRVPAPTEKSGADGLIEMKVGAESRGLLWEKAEHALLADGSWKVLKCDVVRAANSTDVAPQFDLQVTLDVAGGTQMRRLTAAHLNRSLGIVVDGTIVSAPVLRSEIGESLVITGSFSKDFVEKLAASIRKPDRRKKSSSVGTTSEFRSGPFVATLPNGVRVEFVGLAPMEREPQSWWQPNGAALHEVPLHGKETMSVGDRVVRRVQIRLHGGGLSYLDVTPGMTSVLSDEAHGSGGPFVRVDGGYDFLPGQKTGRIELGIATQSQSPVRRLDAKGKRMARNSAATDAINVDAADRVVEDIEVISVGLPPLRKAALINGQKVMSEEKEADNKVLSQQTQVTWRAPHVPRLIGVEVVLIDTTGQRHHHKESGAKISDQLSPDGTPHWGSAERFFRFNVPATDVASFEYRVRPYQHWVTFDNFSLHSGVMTDVKINVESLPRPEAKGPRFTEELRLELKREAAHGGRWFFVDLDRGRLANPPFAVEIDTERLPYFVAQPKEAELNEWLKREGIDLILFSEAKPLGDGSGRMNQRIQKRSVRTNLAHLASGLEPRPNGSWTWKTQPSEVIAVFARKDDTTHVSGFIPDSSGGELRTDSPSLHPFRTAENVLGLFLLEQPNALKDELTLRIVHVANATTPLADVQFAEGDFVSGKNGPADPPRMAKLLVAELPDGLKVEFVGITKNTAPAKGGWRPNGTPIGDVGYWPSTTYISGNTIGSFTENGEHPEPNAGAIDLMFRFRGLKAQPSFAFELAANGGSYSHWPVKDPYELRVAAQRRVPSPPGSKWSIPDGEMRVGLTDEPWGRYVKISPEGKTLDPIQPDERHASTYRLIEVVGTRPHDRAPTGNTVVLRSPLTDANSPANNEGSPDLLHRYAFEFRAIDTEGKNHWADSWSTSQVPNTKLKESQYGLMQPLPAGATLSHYEYRVRPYRHWVTFQGVSLEPGQTTDVKVKVESLPNSDVSLPKPAAGLLQPGLGLGQKNERVVWSHDSKRVYATGGSHKLTIWEQDKAGWMPKSVDAARHANSIAASATSPLVVVGTNLGTAEVWDATTQKRQQLFQPSPQYSVYAVAISADDNRVAACGTNGTVHVFDRDSQRPVVVLGEKADTRMTSLAFSADGKTLAALDRYGHLVLWSIPLGERLAEWKHVAGEDCSVFWSRDGKQLAVSGWGKVTLIPATKDSQPKVVSFPKELRSSDLKDDAGLTTSPLESRIEYASIPAISADLRTVASIAPDGTIGLWDVAHPGVIARLATPDNVTIKDSAGGGMRHLTFSPNGLSLACTTLRGDVVIWQLAQAKDAVVPPARPQAELGNEKNEKKPEALQEQVAAAPKSALRISGRVLDAETGKPIEKVRMVPTNVYREDNKQLTWQTQYLKDFADGRFLYETDRPWDKTKLRIEAEGYQPAMTRVVNKGEVVEIDVKLKRAVLRREVRLPNGQRAVKAQVAIATWTNEINITAGKLSYGHHGEKLRKIVETDEQGHFVVPAEIDPCVIVVAHETGYAEVANAEATPHSTAPEAPGEKPQEETALVILEPWGRVEGRVLMGDKAVVGAKYSVYQARTDDVHVSSSRMAISDAEGRFVVEHLPPGRHGTCQRMVDNSDGTGSHFLGGMLMRFEIPSGKTTTLQLGSPGRTVIGKLALPEGFPHTIDWSKVSLRMSLQAPRFSGRFGGKDESAASWSQFVQTDEGKLYGRSNVAIAADGSFRVEGLPAAEYDLAVSAPAEAAINAPKPAGPILSGSAKFSVPAVVLAAAEQTDVGTIDLKSLVPLINMAEWGRGDVKNGLRARVVPVLASMSEDAIDPVQRVTKFEKPEDVAFVVELENVSDKPIKLLDTRYGEGFGESKGKANSDWLGQFLFSVDLFDQSGKLIERPDVQVVSLDMMLGSALVATLEPGKTHRMLLRPGKWLSPFKLPLHAGRYRAAVRYHGMPERVATRIKEYRPDSEALAAVSGDVSTAAIAFEVTADSRTGTPARLSANEETGKSARPTEATLVWGEPVNGLRVAMSLSPMKTAHAHGEKPEPKLHVQNVSDKPIVLASELWLSELTATVKNDKGESVVVGSTWYSGMTPISRVTLKPQQIVVFDAGNIGLAVTKERAEKFEHVTHRTLVAPAGEYAMQLAGRFGNSFLMKDGKEKVLAPLPGDYIGELKTGVTPLTITNETIECDIVDAVTGKPIADTTTSFIFIKPKSGDVAEEVVAHMIWGLKGPGRIYFAIPDQVMQRADREELEVRWGTGNHPDYENHSPDARIPLKQFFKEGTKSAREALSTIKLTAKKKVVAP